MEEEPLFVIGWEVEGIRMADQFFRAIGTLVPLPAYFCFEGTSIAPDVWSLLESKAIAPKLRLQSGTIFPKPKVLHILATESFLAALADMAAHHAEPEICDHLHAYIDSGLVLQWYDAFDDPLLIGASVPEEAVRQFCGSLGVRYKSWQSG